ncbi:hypothetical protein NHH03_02190 [Stieleria sp. TO1_6]|uniref:FHA domain-containing protein n=1 Tax=Stieleria tagensis TaxID=2956795 RepID=UPI00209B472D|nr:FHA domain-containing protein [Stieleria tagensis]MCO8120532.1 hypothetical protein [Stieleria tagensis]
MSNDHNDIQSNPSDLPETTASESIADSRPVESQPEHSGEPQAAAATSIVSTAFESVSATALESPPLADTDPVDATATNPQTAMEFRVIRPGAAVRRLRLTGNRYTFGSGEGCSIRLDDETLRPMHAVLLRDAHRILMRAYSVPLECNGARTTESTLRVGDVIRMGNYRFELLAASGITAATAVGPTTAQPSGSSTETHLRNKLAELSQQWHARHAECEAREVRCDDRERVLHGRESELWTRAEFLQQREGVLIGQEAAAKEIQATYAETQEELKALRQRQQAAAEELLEKEAELEQKNELLRERQLELQQRQAEWQDREQQYSERFADANEELEKTQQQAKSASAAVQRMRADFSALNEQLTELRERHSKLQQREKREQQEHEQLRQKLETERDAAIDGRASSEAERSTIATELQRVSDELELTRNELAEIRQQSKTSQQELLEKIRSTSEEMQTTREQSDRARREAEEEQAYNEKQIEDLQQQLADVRCDRHTAEQGRLAAETVAEELRSNIQHLQESVAQATADADQLRDDYEGANASIRQLELLVDQTKHSQSSHQDSWSEESEQLRQTIEDLSVQLAQANAELEQLRSAHEALSQELTHSQSESESADSVQQSLTDSAQFQQLQDELDSAKRELDRLQTTHAETIARLQAERELSESELRDEIEQLRNEIASAQAAVLEHSTQHLPGGTAIANDQELELELELEQDAIASASADTVKGNLSDTARALSGETELNPIEDDLASERLVESGDSVWRLESEQPAENHSHLASWHDEAPEHGVDDVIDNIEHHVEQALSDYDQASDYDQEYDRLPESEWIDPESKSTDSIDPTESQSIDDLRSTTRRSNDEPLDWSAYMPGGDALEDDDATIDPRDEAFDSAVVQHDHDENKTVGPLEQLDNAAAAEETDDHDDGEAAGSLAAMLIRDLDAGAPEVDSHDSDDSDPNLDLEPASESTALESEEFDEPADDDDPTLVMKAYQAETDDPSSDESLEDSEGAWNFHSPELESDDDVIADDDPASLENHEDSQPDVSQTAAAAGNETVSNSDSVPDDSIEAYMSRLLGRVHGDSADSSSDANHSREDSSAPSAISADANPGPDPVNDSGPMVPRSPAPESKRDIGAMRDLANQSARNAVARSIRIQARDTQMQAAWKGGMAMSFLAMAIGVYFFVSWSSTIKISMVAAFMVLAGVFIQEGFVLSREARRRLKLADSNSVDLKNDAAVAAEMRAIQKSGEE